MQWLDHRTSLSTRCTVCFWMLLRRGQHRALRKMCCFSQPLLPHFRISRPPATQCLEDFLCITPCSSALPALLQEDGDAAYTHAVTLRALSLYALYMTLGSVRHRTILLGDAPDAFARHAQHGCKGHKGAESLLRRCHIRARDICWRIILSLRFYALIAALLGLERCFGRWGKCMVKLWRRAFKCGSHGLTMSLNGSNNKQKKETQNIPYYIGDLLYGDTQI